MNRAEPYVVKRSKADGGLWEKWTLSGENYQMKWIGLIRWKKRLRGRGGGARSFGFQR